MYVYNCLDHAKLFLPHISLHLSHLDFVFLQWSPSQVAAAAVCATRICVGAPMAWSSELETVTGYHLEDIVEVTDRMLR